MTAGRPKLETERKKQLNIRLSEKEYEDLEMIMKKYNLNKVEAIVKAINLLKDYRPKKFKNLSAFRDNDDDENNEEKIIPINNKKKTSVKTIAVKKS